MSELPPKKLGRPSKKLREDWTLDDFEANAIEVGEQFRCYSRSERFKIADREMRRFLQSSGTTGAEVETACSNVPVFAPFVLSRLFDYDCKSELGGWLLREEWEQVKCWQFLCEKWNKKWEMPRQRGKEQSKFTSVWRLACMVSAWRLLDECAIPSEEEDHFPYPSVSEVMDSAEKWLSQRGVYMTTSPDIRVKTLDRLREVGLGWIHRMGLRKSCPPLYPEGEEPQIELQISTKEMERLEKAIAEYDSVGAARRQLEYLAGLDWPDETEMPG